MQPVICTVAPPAARVETRFAVLASTWSAMPIVMPANGFSLLKLFFYGGEHRHVLRSPFDLQFPEFMNILIGETAKSPARILTTL